MGSNDCGCTSTVQTAPEACCESHEVKFLVGVCFRPTTDIVATEERFYITFDDCQKDIVPINANEVFFYHTGPGLMRIVGYQENTYTVELVDGTRAGRVIKKDDCVLVHVDFGTGDASILNSRCLTGNFTAPALNTTETMYIINGSGIPIGSIITFTHNGEQGSYQVNSFISASGTTYAFEVENTGDGHTPGTIITGDAACSIPLEILTEVDFCNLPNSNTADNLTACVNGSPRAVVPAGEGDILVGTADGKWELAKVGTVDCCVTYAGTLKFSGVGLYDFSDTVVLDSPVPQCFVDAYNEATAKDQVLPANIAGLSMIVTNYNSGNRQATFQLLEIPGSTLEFSEGTQVCLGECCAACVDGIQSSDHKLTTTAPGNINTAAVLSYKTAGGAQTIAYPAGTSYWLLGQNNTTGALLKKQLDAAYFAAPSSKGPKLPKISDPLIIRQKICNSADNGCDQLAMVAFNYQLGFNVVPADMIIDWEIGHYAEPAATLEDGVTLNPGTNIATSAKVSGRISEASDADAQMLGSSFGLGGTTDTKVFPMAAGDLRDFIELRQGDCALSIAWLFFRIQRPTGGSLDVDLRFRRQLMKFNRNLIPQGFNNPASQDFK